MPTSRSFLPLILICLSCFAVAQETKQTVPQTAISNSQKERVKRGNEWFYRGRVLRSQSSADLRKRAYEVEAQVAGATRRLSSEWPDLALHGFVDRARPGASRLRRNRHGTQDYHQVAGRATAVAIDPADPTGNTVYIGGAQSGVWKSINAVNATANAVTWTPLTDMQATLSIGVLAIQPGNIEPTKSLILAATGEARESELIPLVLYVLTSILPYR